MTWPISLLLLQMVQTIAHGHFHYRNPSHSALALVKFCQCPNLEYFDEDRIHELAFTVRTQGQRAGRSFRHVLSAVNIEYARYLQRVRAANMGKENVEILVGNITKKNVWEYITPGPSDRIRAMQYAQRFPCNVASFGNFGSDIVRLAYFNSAMTALETCFLVLFVYKGYETFPLNLSNFSDPIPFSLEVMKDFIATRINEFDYGATYPNAVTCLAFLQYLKFVALYNSELDHAMDAGLQYKKALAALKNMQFNPIVSYTYEDHKLRVCIMPQARTGPKPIPMAINFFNEDSRMFQVSILDVQHPYDPELALNEISQLDAIDLS